MRYIFFSFLITNAILRISGDSDCEPRIYKVSNCNSDGLSTEPEWNWTRKRTYKFVPDFVKGCRSSTLSFAWTLQKDGTSDIISKSDLSSFYIRKYSLEPGGYIVKLTLTETPQNKIDPQSISLRCFVKIHGLPPTAIIKGGQRRQVPTDRGITLSGYYSLDNDQGSGAKRSLTFKWTCSSTNKNVQKYCSQGIIDTTEEFKFDREYVIHGASVTITLEVTSQNGKSDNVSQTCEVRKGSADIYATCYKNCDSSGHKKSNDQLAILLRYMCDAHCQPLDYTAEIIHENNKKKLPMKPKLRAGDYILELPVKFIHKEMNKPLGQYTIRVTHKKSKTEVDFLITMSELTDNAGGKVECNADPNTGVSLETKFIVTCAGLEEDYSYMFFEKQTGFIGNGVLLVVTSSPTAELYLTGRGKMTQIIVKIQGEDYNSITVKMDVEVTSIIKDNTGLNKRMDDITRIYNGRIGALEKFVDLKEKNEVEFITQLSSIIIDEIENLPKSENPFSLQQFSIDMRKKLLNGVMELPMLGDYDYLHIVSLSQKLALSDLATANAEVQALLGKVCHKAALMLKEQLSYERHKAKRQAEIVIENDYFYECAENCFKSNIEKSLETTTAKSVTAKIPEEVRKEDVEEYEELDFNDVKSQFAIATTMGIKVLELAGLQQAKTIKAIDNFVFVKTSKKKNMFLKITTKLVEDFSATPTDLEGIKMKMITTEANVKSKEVSVLTVKFLREGNPFWWNDDAEAISTDIGHVNVFGGPTFESISDLGNPINMQFSVYHSSKSLPLLGTLKITAIKEEWVESILDYQMDIHRADVLAGSNFYLQMECETSLQIALIANRRPRYKDFLIAPTLQSGEDLYFTVPKHLIGRDFWLYIAILPTKDALSETRFESDGKLVIDYKLYLSTQICQFWHWESLKFSSQGCSVHENSTRFELYCYCNHLTTFIGMIKRFDTELTTVMVLTHRLNVQYSYLGLIFITVIYLLFLIIISVGLSRKQEIFKRNRTVFISDNLKSDRYAYLLLVYTGWLPKSGTTGNITLTIVGSKGRSKPHVLNYPDPNKKFLQNGGEDYFLLSTERYLGKILQLHIWTDAIGMRASWYCDSITVADVQTSKKYYFKVRQWLTVLPYGKPYIVVDVYSDLTEQKNFFKRTLTKIDELRHKVQGRPHTFNIFAREKGEELTYSQKIPLIFSIILLMAFFNLFFLGMPHMRMFDGLGTDQFRITTTVIGISFLSSFCSYAVHCCLHLIFLYSNNLDEGTALKRILNGIAWIILLTLIISCMSVLITFGFWVAKVTSLLWLMTTLLGLVVTIIVYEFIYSYVISFLGIKPKLREAIESFQALVREIDIQRVVLFSKFGDYLLRPYLHTKYFPLTIAKVYERRISLKKRLEFHALLREVVLFTVYCFLLFYFVLADRDESMISGNVSLRKILKAGDHADKAINILNIRSLESIYDYINYTLIQSLHPSFWYESYVFVTAGIAHDFQNFLCGIVQIRQLRVKPNACYIPQATRYLNMSCEATWSRSTSGNFDVNDSNVRMAYIWEHKTAKETGSKSQTGILYSYPADGFVAYLGRSRTNSFYNLMYLKGKKWVDFYTRAVIIEFWMYNGNNNAFHAVSILFEKQTTGWIDTKVQIYTSRIVIVNLFRWYSFAFCSILYFIFNLKLLQMNVLRFIRNTRSYLRKFWSYMDMIIISMSIALCFLHQYDAHYAELLLKDLDSKKNNEYVKFWPTFHSNRIYTIMSAFVICLVVMRMWKFLRFCIMFQIMEKTMVTASIPLLCQFIVHGLVMVQLGLTGYLLFVNQTSIFCTPRNTIIHQLLSSINIDKHMDWHKIVKLKPFIGYSYHMLNMISTLFFFRMYIVILLSSHHQNLTETNLSETLGIKQYVMEEYKFIKYSMKAKVENARLKGGKDTAGKKRLALPKAEEVRYANCQTIDELRFEMMNLVARAVVTNKMRKDAKEDDLYPKDYELMSEIAINYCKRGLGEKKGKERFFKTYTYKDKKYDMHFISDERLRDIEFLVNSMLVIKDEYHPPSPIPKVSVLDRLKVINQQVDQIKTVITNIAVIKTYRNQRLYL